MTEAAHSDYAITITDCNSIAEARITLRRESLNIKYGPNGIGKSTIARALVLNAEGGDALQDLLPFKYRQGDSGESPAVLGPANTSNDGSSEEPSRTTHWATDYPP